MVGKEFVITEDHIILLTSMYVGWEDCEYGAPAIDCKRPYGNSSVEQDIAELLGWHTQEELEEMYENDDEEELYIRARAIHEKMETVLQIVLKTKLFEPGTYRRSENYFTDWEKVDNHEQVV